MDARQGVLKVEGSQKWSVRAAPNFGGKGWSRFWTERKIALSGNALIFELTAPKAGLREIFPPIVRTAQR